MSFDCFAEAVHAQFECTDDNITKEMERYFHNRRDMNRGRCKRNKTNEPSTEWIFLFSTEWILYYYFLYFEFYVASRSSHLRCALHVIFPSHFQLFARCARPSHFQSFNVTFVSEWITFKKKEIEYSLLMILTVYCSWLTEKHLSPKVWVWLPMAWYLKTVTHVKHRTKTT